MTHVVMCVYIYIYIYICVYIYIYIYTHTHIIYTSYIMYVLEGGDALVGVGDRGLGVLDGLLELLLLVLGHVELRAAVLLLVLVVHLLLLEGHDQIVDQLDDLLEADLLASEVHK